MESILKPKRGSSPKDHRGLRYGRLVAVQYIGVNSGTRTKGAVWECKCDCGNMIQALARNLVNGNTQSCGCLHKERTAQAHLKRPFEMLYNKLLSVVKHLKRECSLTYDEFLDFTNHSECRYCSGLIEWQSKGVRGQRGYGAYHLDRKNSELGYSKDNCVVCCASCNRIKSNVFSYDEMLELGQTLKTIRLARNEKLLPFLKRLGAAS